MSTFALTQATAMQYTTEADRSRSAGRDHRLRGPRRRKNRTMSRPCRALVPSVLLLALVGPAAAVCPPDCVSGGGLRTADCVSVFDAPGANTPAPPRTPRNVDCVDGDPSCDTDGQRNAQCVFNIRLCINSTAVTGCTPDRTDSVTVAHALDNGDQRFDTDFQALQQR